MSSKPEKFQLVGQTSKAMSSQSTKSQPELFLNELELGVTGLIVVMICRMWDVNTSTGRYLSTDFIVSDSAN
nr:hypothetical protein [Tanacetum cinerariifolium]